MSLDMQNKPKNRTQTSYPTNSLVANFYFFQKYLGGKMSKLNGLRRWKIGNRLYFWQQRIRGHRAKFDLKFPVLLNLEIVSSCNLRCIHCPSHSPNRTTKPRKFGIMDPVLFAKAMDEIDQHGKRRISLHKDGEPLMHPKIREILSRVKKHHDHELYLTTNGQLLSEEIGQAILDAKVDILNLSLGAASPELYQKIRGGQYDKVLRNIHHFLSLRQISTWKPKVLVQIINLQDLDMHAEISAFRDYWKDFDVEIQVWDELSWGTKRLHTVNYRYPCFSLWESFNLNSDGQVTVCCMDWKQSMCIGDLHEQSIKDIWQSTQLSRFRSEQIGCHFDDMSLCKDCNYWFWQPMLPQYPL